MKQHFLMLAHQFDPKKDRIEGWFMSHKLDGMRVLWDGGVTRGMELDKVPWANTEKDSRYVVQPKATGLWTRYGKSIQAPDWWLDLLPEFLILDGELYMGRGQFQSLMSAAKQLKPGPEWKKIKYMIFDSPPVYTVFASREIDETNFKKTFANIEHRIKFDAVKLPSYQYRMVYHWLLENVGQNDHVKVLPQIELPYNRTKVETITQESLDKEIAIGGEGLMFRKPQSFWTPSRVRTLLKMKGMLDDEATVIGYTAGRETDKGSKLLGLMGAMILSYKGKTFELSGFTDEERKLVFKADGSSAYDVVSQIPSDRVPDTIHNPMFPIGSTVSFKYRELTKDGLPKEARFWRKHVE
jgi:DNA ligase 1